VSETTDSPRPRVAVTTSDDRYDQIAGPLGVAGCDPVRLPCIQVTVADSDTVAQVRSQAERSDLVVLTSQRPVSIVWPDGMDGISVLAVGHSTAEVAQRAGATIVGVGAGGGLELATLLASTLASKRVLYPHASGASAATQIMLGRSAAEVAAYEIYQVGSVPPGDDQVDAAMFASPSAVAGWVSSRSLEGILVAAIGGTTSTALREHGVTPDVVPERPGFLGLIAATASASIDRLLEKEAQA
jgi:uroporphyrinogen-III synthase